VPLCFFDSHFALRHCHRPSPIAFDYVPSFASVHLLFTLVHDHSRYFRGEGASCHSLNSQLRDSSLITLTNTVKTQRKHTEKHIQTPMKHTKTQKNTLEKNRARAGPRLATPADPFNPTPREAPNNFAFGSHSAPSTQHSAPSTQHSAPITQHQSLITHHRHFGITLFSLLFTLSFPKLLSLC
jgi:hypothetical protein